MELFEQAIIVRAVEVFRIVESNVIAMRALLQIVHAAMHRLQEQYRREMPGFRLVLYLKKRSGCKDTMALYWVAFCGPPEELFTVTGDKKVRFVTYIAGGLSACDIYKHSEASRKKKLREYDRRAVPLNEAHKSLVAALQSAEKRWVDRGVRRPWECQDFDLEAPELSNDLDKRYHAAMGGAWRFITRMVATGKGLETHCSSYQAAPIHRNLNLRFTPDDAHPHGRARWFWKGNPLARLKKSGIQDRLTDSWMRRKRIKAETRSLLSGVELRRRSLARQLQYYTGLFGSFLKRSGEALVFAEQCLAAAERRIPEVA